jgi:hypothetical protein
MGGTQAEVVVLEDPGHKGSGVTVVKDLEVLDKGSGVVGDTVGSITVVGSITTVTAVDLGSPASVVPIPMPMPMHRASMLIKEEVRLKFLISKMAVEISTLLRMCITQAIFF